MLCLDTKHTSVQNKQCIVDIDSVYIDIRLQYKEDKNESKGRGLNKIN